MVVDDVSTTLSKLKHLKYLDLMSIIDEIRIESKYSIIIIE